MKQTGWFAAMVSLVLAVSAKAEGLYSVEKGSVLPGTTAVLISRDVQIGKPGILPQPEGQNSPRTLQDLKTWIDGLQAQFRDELEASNRDMNLHPKNGPQARTTTEQTSVSRSTSENHPSTYDLIRLRNCAKEMLPVLKRKLGLMHSDDLEAMPKISDLEISSILPNAGRDRMGNPNGLACGVFLGRTIVPRPDIHDEIRILTALASRPGEDLRPLLRAFVASRSSESPVMGEEFWDIRWRKLALQAVFSRTPLDELNFNPFSIPNKHIQSGIAFGKERIP